MFVADSGQEMLQRIDHDSMNDSQIDFEITKQQIIKQLHGPSTPKLEPLTLNPKWAPDFP